MIGPMTAFSFRHIDPKTIEDCESLHNHGQENICGLPDRILATLEVLRNELSGYQFNRLEHFLQIVMRAKRNRADIELIVAALIHGVGDDLASENHFHLASASSRPCVRAKITWTLKKHGLLQMYDFVDKLLFEKDGKDTYRGHKFLSSVVNFCQKWNQISFGPSIIQEHS